jgi:meso-butanediol dehydrogenase/(S,S)-butanediol dehydrogenase/diacetyl reductase
MVRWPSLKPCSTGSRKAEAKRQTISSGRDEGRHRRGNRSTTRAWRDFGPIDETDFARWRTVMETNLDGRCFPRARRRPIPALKATRAGRRTGQHRLDLGAARLDAAGGLRHLQGRRDAPDQAAGGRARRIRHPRQLRLPRPGPHEARHGRPQPGDHRRLPRCDPAEPLRLGGEIAEVIAFLCSDKASYVTGQVIASDGGFESTGVGLPALRT